MTRRVWAANFSSNINALYKAGLVVFIKKISVLFFILHWTGIAGGSVGWGEGGGRCMVRLLKF